MFLSDRSFTSSFLSSVVTLHTFLAFRRNCPRNKQVNSQLTSERETFPCAARRPVLCTIVCVFEQLAFWASIVTHVCHSYCSLYIFLTFIPSFMSCLPVVRLMYILLRKWRCHCLLPSSKMNASDNESLKIRTRRIWILFSPTTTAYLPNPFYLFASLFYCLPSSLLCRNAGCNACMSINAFATK